MILTYLTFSYSGNFSSFSTGQGVVLPSLPQIGRFTKAEAFDRRVGLVGGFDRRRRKTRRNFVQVSTVLRGKERGGRLSVGQEPGEQQFLNFNF
jgi:hypothetical protein